ncbi:MAG TPA: preprotein translocase subunit YajC [Dehalococcoidia bacterium]|nr:preprotein translocase subunit YajC [Dehalococcoidia bacterium]
MEQLQSIAPILFLVLIFAAMYFFMIKPQRKRQKEQQELVQELRRGEKVVTTGGIYGQIESISQDTVVLRIESGATMKVARASVIGKQGK